MLKIQKNITIYIKVFVNKNKECYNLLNNKSGDIMEPIFKNSTEYTNKLYNEYISFYRKKFGKNEILIGILAIFLTINIAIKGFEILGWMSILVWLGIIGIISLCQVFREKIQVLVTKITKESYSYIIRRKNKNVIYNFYNSFFEAKYNGEQDRVSYLKLRKVFELEDRYYLCINKNSSFIVLKSGFTKGESSDFSDFIKSKGNYRVKKVKSKTKSKSKSKG